MQVPRGPEDMNCPKWLSPMSEVCHKCPLWTRVKMIDHQTKEDVDDWRCALAWQPAISIAILNKIDERLQGVEIEINALRNETKTAHDDQMTMGAIAVQRSRDVIQEAIENSVQSLRHYPDTQKLIEKRS